MAYPHVELEPYVSNVEPGRLVRDSAGLTLMLIHSVASGGLVRDSAGLTSVSPPHSSLASGAFGV